jgi:hypothetical protein
VLDESEDYPDIYPSHPQAFSPKISAIQWKDLHAGDHLLKTSPGKTLTPDKL